MELDDIQINAVNEMHNGCVLNGDTGSGKTRTAIAYYLKACGGAVMINGDGTYIPMSHPRDLYVITTAKKRDSLDWETEAAEFGICDDPKVSHSGVKITVDSWNNIVKYKKIKGSFFIFDEQRAVGSGVWATTFIKIAQNNQWVLLSATPGDNWADYIPIFIANGFYRNRTEFLACHARYAKWCKNYPKIVGWFDEAWLYSLRKAITVEMPVTREREIRDIWISCSYNKDLYSKVWEYRWDPFNDEPIEETGALFYLMRKVVNSDISRCEEIRKLYDLGSVTKAIIFYNFDFELEMLKNLFSDMGIECSEWNGHKHESVPTSDKWGYFVQYISGCEGWNCITTDTIIFYSLNYSYRITKQARGRIDRRNTPYGTLYYYFLKSYAPIDIAIRRALIKKEDFNQSKFLENKI